MMAGAGGAMRATGWRATASGFDNSVRGVPSVYHFRCPHARARGGADSSEL